MVDEDNTIKKSYEVVLYLKKSMEQALNQADNKVLCHMPRRRSIEDLIGRHNFQKVTKLLIRTKTLHKVKHKKTNRYFLNLSENYYNQEYEKTNEVIREYERIGKRKEKILVERIRKLENKRRLPITNIIN